eukprot:TRINITY_DN6664_c0_g1_i2.p1 TRINITY_DN6664_c0_g1~~TRINITY_DN6664_c0_g1_i2.p1  ORF type:complete len:228 (-),score=41.86 TRINITY_DN6664_c0_g1_i2:55-738(-)
MKLRKNDSRSVLAHQAQILQNKTLPAEKVQEIIRDTKLVLDHIQMEVRLRSNSDVATWLLRSTQIDLDGIKVEDQTDESYVNFAVLARWRLITLAGESINFESEFRAEGSHYGHVECMGGGSCDYGLLWGDGCDVEVAAETVCQELIDAILPRDHQERDYLTPSVIKDYFMAIVRSREDRSRGWSWMESDLWPSFYLSPRQKTTMHPTQPMRKKAKTAKKDESEEDE